MEVDITPQPKTIATLVANVRISSAILAVSNFKD